MTPQRPYFLRAFHEWLSDNEMTPLLLVDTTHPDIIAPTEYAQDGKLVLNVSYSATKDFIIENEAVSFSARFGGISKEIWLPIACVQGIYAKEDGALGAFFDPSEYPAKEIEPAKEVAQPTKNSATKSPFKVIK